MGLFVSAGDACQPAVQHVSILGVLRMAICTQHAADAASWLADQVRKFSNFKQPFGCISGLR